MRCDVTHGAHDSPDLAHHLQHPLPLPVPDLGGAPPRRAHAEAGAARVARAHRRLRAESRV